MGNVTIRKAERQDVPMLLEFIRGIARYEKMENEVVATPEVLEREMFDEHRAEAVLRVWEVLAAASGKDCTGTPLRKNGMDVPELEQAKHRLLPLTWSRTYEGLDGLPA